MTRSARQRTVEGGSIALIVGVVTAGFGFWQSERDAMRSELRRDKAAVTRAANQATIDGLHANLLKCSVALSACEVRCEEGDVTH